MVAPEDGILDTKLKTKRTVPFKNCLVLVPFPLVTTFETTGTYKNGCGLTVRRVRYVAFATIMEHVPPYIEIYLTSHVLCKHSNGE